MIKEYKVFKELLGHVPSSREVTKYSASGHGYSTQAYLDHFGSLSNLQQLCGYLPTRIGRTKTRDDLLSDLKQLGDELGRTPSVYDLKGRDDLASLSMYQREFGSFADALKLIGYKPNLKIITTNKGNKCLSYLEYKFTKMLEHFGLKFKREVRYSDYIDFDRQYRFDYVVDVNGKEVFVEIFGIIKNEKYANRKQEKIMLCKQNGLPLVAYERKDLWNTSNQKLYDDFLHRAEQVLQVVSECDN
jgi:hypothetical protein